jgi:hypothetical protein
MAIIFDPINKRIVLDSDYIKSSEIWSRWVDWISLADNLKYLPAMRQAGGDEIGGGLYTPIYIFLLNDWRVRPREANSDLEIDGNLVVEGGGTPVVRTLGNYQVNVKYTVPIQAQAITTSATSGLTAAEIAAAVWSLLGTNGKTHSSMLEALPTLQDIENSDIIAKEATVNIAIDMSMANL